MSKKPDPFDVPSVNPCYKGATPADMVRALMRPRDPEGRAALDRLRGQSVTPGKMPDDPPAIRSGV